MLLKVCPALLCILYAATLVEYGRLFRLGRTHGRLWARPLLVVTILAHLLFLVWLAREHHHSVAVNTGSVAISFLALSLAVAYFLIEWITKERNMGVWVLGLPLVFQIVSSAGLYFIRPAPTPLLEHAFLAIHVGLAMIGYCAFSLSMAFSVMYLVLYNELKRHRVRLVFERLPSLDTLEQMAYRAIHAGLGFTLVAVVFGELLFYDTEGRYVVADAKIVVALTAFIVYGAAVLLRKPLAIQGRRLALTSIAGFCIILFSLLVVDYLPGFHRF